MAGKIKILNVVGARPNFMKIAPLFRTYKKNKNIDALLVHTNQHSGDKMSGIFFKSLGIPDPDYSLKTKNGSPVLVISGIMAKLDKIILKEKPDFVLVVGDVNSTLAGALAANKLGVKVVHVEAGLRSGDLSMPEEVNRILVDRLSDLLFVTEKSGMVNLKKEGVKEGRTYFVGNVMIDNLIYMLPKVEKSQIIKTLNLKNKSYAVITMHRPANVDTKIGLSNLLKTLRMVRQKTGMPIIFPIHPRTAKSLKRNKLWGEFSEIPGIVSIDPLGYVDFIKLMKESAFVLTDSGGIQEEASYLKVPVVTLRDSTERPSTVACGANVLCKPGDAKELSDKITRAIGMDRSMIKDIELNDGKASERIVSKFLNK